MNRLESSLSVLRSTMTIAICCVVAGCAVAPEPLTSEAMDAFAATKRADATAGQEPVTRAIDLYEAIARSLKYNLDARVEELQRDLKIRDFERASLNMLPGLVANTGYAARDEFSGGTSQSLITGQQSLEASTSQERKLRTADLSFSWNILDFGLSFVRARQAADEALVADEARRKAINRIVEDVQTAFWRAVSSEKLAADLRALGWRVQGAIRRTRALARNNETSPITAITYERELVEIKREVERLEGELRVAKTQLAALMNLDPATRYSLVLRSKGIGPGRLGEPEQMVDIALRNRPEMAEVALKLRINRNEAHAALLELLPGIQLYAGSNFDSNEFLFTNDWVNWGAKASWNLMRLVQYPARRASVEAGDELLNERALAVTMAIMTQVYVSRIRYAHTKKELATASEYLDVQTRLIEKMRIQAGEDRISEQTLIREEMNTLVARVRRDIAFSAHQSAIANMYSTVGRDPCTPEFVSENGVDAIAQLLRSGNGWHDAFFRVAER